MINKTTKWFIKFYKFTTDNSLPITCFMFGFTGTIRSWKFILVHPIYSFIWGLIFGTLWYIFGSFINIIPIISDKLKGLLTGIMLVSTVHRIYSIEYNNANVRAMSNKIIQIIEKENNFCADEPMAEEFITCKDKLTFK